MINYAFHNVALWCLRCFRGKQLSLWRMGKLGVLELRNPKLFDKIFGMGYYVGDIT